MTRPRSALIRFLRDRRGSQTIEFVWVLPAIIFFIFAYGEVGVLAARAVLLERGLDLAIRDVRLGKLPSGLSPEQMHEQIKWRVCNGAFLVGNCMDDLHLEMTATPLGGDLPSGSPDCRDRRPDAIQPVVSMNQGSRQNADTEILLVRACLPVNPIFPGTGIGAGLPKDPSGGYRIMTETAFLNEPG